MGRANDVTESMPVTAFEQRSPELVQRNSGGPLKRLVLTEQGRTVAVSRPVYDDVRPLWGALGCVMEPVEGVDLTAPLEEGWAAGRA